MYKTSLAIKKKTAKISNKLGVGTKTEFSLSHFKGLISKVFNLSVGVLGREKVSLSRSETLTNIKLMIRILKSAHRVKLETNFKNFCFPDWLVSE